jgi:hypothetical protein
VSSLRHKSHGWRLRGCNVRNMNPEKAEWLSPELQSGGVEKLNDLFRNHSRPTGHSSSVPTKITPPQTPS